MGSAVAASPLLSHSLAGIVVFVETGATPDIGLDLQGQLHLLLRGSLGLDKAVVFDGLPDIPIAHFALTFPSAPGLLIASRNSLPPCSSTPTTGYSRPNPVDSSATVRAPADRTRRRSAKRPRRSTAPGRRRQKKHKRSPR
jgi:hypothetical protein